jgi:hypothetical protein
MDDLRRSDKMQEWAVPDSRRLLFKSQPINMETTQKRRKSNKNPIHAEMSKSTVVLQYNTKL